MPARAIQTPLGWITLTEENGALTRLDWARNGTDVTPLLAEAQAQLTAYFAHTLQSFDLPLAPSGGAFQQAVNAAMRAIPFGQTRTYAEIARALGSMPQPVGNACGANSLPILIPCHRVVGTSGIGGFSARGGVETKVALLKHEGAYGLLI